MNIRHILTGIFLFISVTVFSQITEIGLASFYADKFDGRVTASGETFDQNKMTAAHRTFPFGTKVKVTNLQNKKTVVVTINDRGPFVKDRVIDLSKAAANQLDFIKEGVARVKIEVISLGKTTATTTSATKHTKTTTKVVATSTVTKQDNHTPVANASTHSESDYFRISAEKISPSGYGVQVASYRDVANVIQRSNAISKQAHGKDVIIKTTQSGDATIYKVVIGTFKTRQEASDFNKKLGGAFPGSFVVSF